MSADISIYDHLRTNFDNVYFQRFPQSVNLISSVPRILIINDSQNETDTKDKTGRQTNEYSIEVIGTEYQSVKTKGIEIIQSLKNFTDTYVYLVTYEGKINDFSIESEVHRTTLNFIIYINENIS